MFLVLSPAGFAQDQAAQPAAAPTPAPASRSSSDRPFVRKFSAGGTLSFLPFSLIKGSTSEMTVTDPAAAITGTGESKSNWFSGGAVVQYAFTERLAVNANVLFRSAGYKLTTVNLIGTDDTTTSADERVQVNDTEVTHARYIDVPVVVRRYNIGRHTEGFRWFYEAGAALRNTYNVRTSIQRETSDFIDCCKETPTTPAHRNIFGLVAGGGLQLMDDYGIKIVPEVRYTRWLSRSFDSLGARSSLDQLEAMVSFTF